VLLSAIAALAVLSGGCGQAERKAEQAAAKTDQQAAGQKPGDHSGWWCAEHGVPEKECSMCQDDVAKECKARGDWCDQHNRAKSQCFKCDPTLKEKYAARYRIKNGGKDPPPTEDEEPEQPKKEPNE
jgi:hypothetical protein